MSEIKLVELGKSTYAVHYENHYIGYVCKRGSVWQGATATGGLIPKNTKTRAAMIDNLKERFLNVAKK